MTDVEHFHVFFSHSHADADVVERIAGIVEDNSGLRVWLDRWSLVPGEEWQQQIARALVDVECCAVFIGQGTPAGWFDQEIQRALHRQSRDKKFRVIPVLLPGSDIKMLDNFLELRHLVDFRGGIADTTAMHRLTSGVRGVPPGRLRQEQDQAVLEPEMRNAVNKLKRISDLREQELLRDDVVAEYQRKILDKIIEL